MKTCPDCNGDGVIEKGTDDEQRCPTCGGSGFVPDDGDDKTQNFFPSVVVKNSADTDFFTGTAAITDINLFTGAPITGWPLLIDIDDEAPNLNNGVDVCCLPSLDALRALIMAVK